MAVVLFDRVERSNNNYLLLFKKINMTIMPNKLFKARMKFMQTANSNAFLNRKFSG